MSKARYVRRRVTMISAILLALAAVPVSAAPPSGEQGKIAVSSSAFKADTDMPTRFSCQAKGVSPPLSWSGTPKKAKSLALVVDDPDAPSGNWVHWVVYNLPAGTRGLDEGAGDSGLPHGTANGKNSWGDAAYGGVCPPSGRHHYHFKVYALDTTLADKHYKKQALLEAMHGHVLARGELVATYRKQ